MIRRRSGANGSFVPIYDHEGQDHQLFAVWTSAYIEFYFQYYRHKRPFDAEEKRRELLGRLNAIEGVSLGEDVLARRPSIPLSVFANEKSLGQLQEAFEWVMAEIEAS